MSPVAVGLRLRPRPRRWHVLRIHRADAAEQRDNKLVLRSTLPVRFPGWPYRLCRTDSQIALNRRRPRSTSTLRLHRPKPSSPPLRQTATSTRLRQPPLTHPQQPQPLDQRIDTRPFPHPHRPLLPPRATIGIHPLRLLLMLPAKAPRRVRIAVRRHDG